MGRRWPTNLENDPNITLVVTNPENGYSFVEIRGTATGTEDGAIDQIHALAHKYLGERLSLAAAGRAPRDVHHRAPPRALPGATVVRFAAR